MISERSAVSGEDFYPVGAIGYVDKVLHEKFDKVDRFFYNEAILDERGGKMRK